jgi:ABC-type phosphate transport system substrate-binding protein
MPVLRKRTGALISLVAIAATTLALATPASADSSARTTDVIGVGSDTVQNIVDFVLDGAPGVAGGYNSAGNNHRAWSFFATGDANGRATYDGTCGTAGSDGLGTLCSATTNSAPNLLPGSVVLRAGTDPVVRPNGSGAGLTAITNDSVNAGSGATATTGYETLAGGSIDFVRASRQPKTTEESACDAKPTTCGGLHTYQIATDNLGIATVASGFAGPAQLSKTDLIGIYNCTITTWGAIPGYSGSHGTDTIHPLIPQSGSGTRNFFESDLGIGDTFPACVRVVEEHDPTGIYQDTTPQDTIEPFSTGKLALINSGYFKNPGYSGTGEPQGAYTPGFLTTLGHTTNGADGGTADGYFSTRGLYIILRQVDVTATVGMANPFGADSPFGATYPAFQAGGTQTYAQTLFLPGGFFSKSLNSSLFAAAGVTQAYKDCGNDMQENGNPNGCV